MIYILLVLYSSGPLSSTEFNDLKSCQGAARLLLIERPAIAWKTPQFAVCVPKGIDITKAAP